MNRLQSVQFNILKDVARFCEKNDITYFICYGTLLGAIRHGGFIPWDDDIDIGMDLENYKKFLRLAPGNLGKDYFVQNYITDEKYGFAWTKVRKNGTTSMEPSLRNYHIHYGIDIDIFLFSGKVNSSLLSIIQKRLLTEYIRLLKKHYLISKNGGTRPNNNYVFFVPERLRKGLLHLLERKCFLKLSHHKTCFCCGFFNLTFPSSMFMKKNLILVEFENEKFYAPKDYIEFLTITYGDWEKLPPENQRTGHGDMIIDFENDYTKYWY